MTTVKTIMRYSPVVTKLRRSSSGVLIPRSCHGGLTSNDDDLPWQRNYYKYFLPIQTRWSDNDQYGHVNNVAYYSYFDTVINHYLINRCGLNTDIKTSKMIGYMVDTKCVYKTPISFPEIALAGLAISHVGRSSVRYIIGIFPELTREGSVHRTERATTEGSFPGHSSTSCAVGHCIHVFVDSRTNRPVTLPDAMREALERVAVPKEPTGTSKL